MIATVKYASAFVLAAGVLIGVGLHRPDVQAGPKPADAKSAQAATPKTSEPAAPPEYAGRVVDADGKPVKGARLYVLYYTPAARPVPERATTDADGRTTPSRGSRRLLSPGPTGTPWGGSPPAPGRAPWPSEEGEEKDVGDVVVKPTE